MKKLFVLLLSGVMITTSIPAYSFAATKPVEEPVTVSSTDAAGNQNEPTSKALEAVILAVKEKITIPKEYTDFYYYFYDTNSYYDSSWNLSWSDPKTGSSIQVNCDVNKHITYFYHYDYSEENKGVATYLKSELKAKADEFIKKIAPDIASKLQYVSADYSGVYNGNYVYTYKRVNNGIELPDNSVTVSMNSTTGEARGITINWLYDAKLPTATATITKDQATKLIKENMKMKLVYRSDYYGIYDKGTNPNTKAYLVYEPTENYVSVDAKSGKVYLSRNEWVYGSDSSKNESASTADTGGNGSSNQILTEEEIAKIDELKNLISKAKAIETVKGNQSLYLDKNLTSYTATLNKTEDQSGNTTYVWNINLSDPREVDSEKDTDTYRGYANATVDAKTGKILSFHASMKSYYDEATNTWKKVNISYDKEKSRTILENFMKLQMKDRFSKTILAQEYGDYVAYYKAKDPVYGGYAYQYNRVNEGIEYPYNNLYGSVDGVTGKIYSYGSNWNDNVQFESTKGVITAEKAMDYYLSKVGYGLKYEINQINTVDSKKSNYTVEYEIRLVYRPDVNPAMISPFTGEQLNYNGEVYKETKSYSYLDIKDNKEYRNVLLLADMNIGFEGDNFLPTKEITLGEFNELLNKVGYGYTDSSKLGKNANNPITKEELAQTIIVQMRLEKVSQLSGIYTTGFADEASIDKKYLGAVALAKGYGIISADANNYFNPKNKVTRLEAVNAIVSYIGAIQQGIFY